MAKDNKFLVIAAVVIIACILQVFLAIADQRDTPHKAAVEFAKAYHMLNQSMADRLCSELAGDDAADVVDDYLQRVAEEARATGFGINWMKRKLFHIDTVTHKTGDNEAKVEITAASRRSINPIYFYVARWFFLGETNEIEEVLNLVKENGRWKVCGEPFSLVEG